MCQVGKAVSAAITTRTPGSGRPELEPVTAAGERRGIKRRTFLGGAGVTAVTSLAAPARAQGRRELRMVTTWPENFPGLSTSAERIALTIRDLTEGRLNVSVHAADTLVPAFESFDAVARGDVDAYHAIDSYWLAKSPAFAFFAAVPFGLTPQETIAWVYGDGGQKLWDNLAALFNVKPLMAGNTGAQMALWSKREINDVEDLRGLRLALPGLGGSVMRRLGASAVALPGRALVEALTSDTIDGVEWFGPWLGVHLGLPDAAPYYYYPGVHEPGIILSLGINLDLWMSLEESERAAIRAATAAETTRSLAAFEVANARTLPILKAAHGIEPRPLPDTVLQAIGAAAGAVVAEAADTDVVAEKVYNAFIAFRRSAVTWSRPALHAYLDARLLPFPYAPAGSEEPPQ